MAPEDHAGGQGGLLKRSGSRSNLIEGLGSGLAAASTPGAPPAQSAPTQAPESANATPQAVGSAPGQPARESTNLGSNTTGGQGDDKLSATAAAPPSAPSPSRPGGLLKRSRSMGTFDGIMGRGDGDLNFGKNAVESISGKVTLPGMVPPSAAAAKPVRSSSRTPIKPAASFGGPSPSSPTVNKTVDSAPALAAAPSSSSSKGSSPTAPKKPAVVTRFPPGPGFGPPKPRQPNHARSAGPGAAARHASPSPTSPRGAVGSPREKAAEPLLSPDQLAHDDSQIERKPLIRVDYFSHKWNESDIAGSWRYIVSRRQDMANSARLENASWRTWAKAKNNLKTVSPETLNWLKDYDVTWLYGPLYHEHSSDDEDEGASDAGSSDAAPDGSHLSTRTGDRTGTDSVKGSPRPIHKKKPTDSIKSILKKKTIAQIMLEDTPGYKAHVESQSGQVTDTYLRHHNYRHSFQTDTNKEHMANLLNQAYSRSNSAAGSRTRSPDGTGAGAGAAASGAAAAAAAPTVAAAAAAVSAAAPGTPGDGTDTSDGGRHVSVSSAASGERHVHFNVRVEQCIALDPEEELRGSEGAWPASAGAGSPQAVANDSETDESDDDDEENEKEGGLFLGIRRAGSNANLIGSQTIAPLPATTLKHPAGEEQEESIEQIASAGQHGAGGRMSGTGLTANYDYGSVYPSSSVYSIVDPAVKPVQVPASVASQVSPAGSSANVASNVAPTQEATDAGAAAATPAATPGAGLPDSPGRSKRTQPVCSFGCN